MTKNPVLKCIVNLWFTHLPFNPRYHHWDSVVTKQMWWTMDMFLVMLSGLSGGEYCGSVECNLLSLWSPIYNWTLVFGISGILSRRNILQEDLLYKLPSLLVTKVELSSLFQHKYIFPIKKNKKNLGTFFLVICYTDYHF